MAFLRKLCLIAWKDWIFRKRHYVVTLFDIALPLLFTLLLVAMHGTAAKYHSKYVAEPTIYLKEEIYLWKYGTFVTIMYSPNTSHTEEFMELVKETIYNNCLINVSLIGVCNEEEMDKVSRRADLERDSNLAGGISFVDEFAFDEKPARNLHYRIRMRGYQWETTKLTHPFSDPGPQEDTGIAYKFSDFLIYQHAVAMTFIELATDNSKLKMKLYSQRFPYPPYRKDSKYSTVMEIIFPFFIILSYVFISPSVIRGIVLEKELGIKELMKLMGLPGWIQWLGWFFGSFVFMSVSAVITIVLLCSPLSNSPLLAYSSPVLVLFIFYLFIASAIMFCFFISSLFSRPTVATAVGILIWTLTFIIPYYYLLHSYSRLALYEKMLVALLPNMAMAWALRMISIFERRTVGLQWEYLAQPAHIGENMNMLHVVLMFVCDIIIYAMLTWYIDSVFPGKYGVGKPWYFLITKSYWMKEKSADVDTASLSPHKNSIDFEKDPVGLLPTVVIKHFTKHYSIFKLNKPAVDDVSMKFYEDQITVLLGQNGAGKTTVLSMLSGMFVPTKGTAFINGYNIKSQTAAARENLGLCPQESMLFDVLTVKEHLWFFGKLKHISGDTLASDIDSLMTKLQLQRKAGTLAKNLSGGMKRKLSLGIALIGGNKVVILDEPSSGLDPDARRSAWDLLMQYRPGKCIILTTHSMEEADVLGDRIAIMAHGKLQCCGTPYFLKKRFGTGYHLTISKTKECDIDQLSSVIRRHLPEAVINMHVNNEISYILPVEKTRHFPDLFAELENNLHVLGIYGMGVSLTTMEEVFLKVGKLTETNERDDLQSGDKPEKQKLITLYNREMLNVPLNVGRQLHMQQFQGLLMKRWHYSRRRWILVFAQIIMPVLLVILLLYIINQSGKEVSRESPLKMDISHYGKTVAVENHTLTEHGIALADAYRGVFPAKDSIKTVGNIEKYLIAVGNKSYDKYQQKYIVAAEFQSLESGISYITAFYSGIYLHALPLAVNLIHNTILHQQTRTSDWNITVENAPLPIGLENVARRDEEVQYMRAVLTGVFIPFGLAFLSSSFVVFPIQERISKSKHLQLMTGVGETLFWGSSFLWDIMIHLVSSSLMVTAFTLMDNTKTFSGKAQAGVVFALLTVYGWAAIPFSYLLSFFCKQSASGYSFVLVVHLISGMILSLVVFVFKNMKSTHMVYIGNVLQWCFRLLPNYPITIAFINMPLIVTENSLCEAFEADMLEEQCKDESVSSVIQQCCPGCVGSSCLGRRTYFGWESPSLGQEVLMLGVDGIIYLLLLIFIESGVLTRRWFLITSSYFMTRTSLSKSRKRPLNSLDTEKMSGTIDDDVVLENNRVKQIFLTSTQSDDDVLLVDNLTKQYWGLRAVDHLCFGVKNGECFGLLGVNGAGKTTTFRMLAGDEVVTRGNAYLRGVSLRNNLRLFLMQVGYCPQFSALLDHLTARETLYLFGRLRGIPEQELQLWVDNFLHKFGLIQYADKVTAVYSGGNKRKLSLAIALLGNPSIVFLDEPTTGVDPVAKRKLWDMILTAKNSGTSIVLTSHSMEECEVLCNRLAIMVNGQFKCLGPIQHLKNKFGQGFTIIAKLRTYAGSNLQTNMPQELNQFMSAKFPGCVLKDIHQELLNYHVADTKTTWKYLFFVMEEAKLLYNLEDYSVSQTTLEQVFLSFSRQQWMDSRKYYKSER